ncbi:MAG: YitT family protein [Acidaminococcus sp.]|nr:YitT family protein [Acidaminococcus sp.]MCI2115122.1 YitT family protein [Acidaminococcus sp.]MCI2117198.1 YitT family protein [Acidaminococcus sp.]
MDTKIKQQCKRYLTITLGTCLSGIAMNAFFMPYELLSGGITGLGMILYYLFGWPVSVTNIVINIPLFFMAYKLMSRSYFISGIYGTLSLSFFLHIFSFLSTAKVVQNPMLACIAAGTLHGMGLGILYRVGGSTGGTDIIGAIVQKFYSIEIGTTGFAINVILLCSEAFLFGIEPALYTLIAYFFVAKVSNAFADGFNYKKNVFIISEKNEQIAEAIMKTIDRGVTYINAEGAYTHHKRQILFCVVKLTQVARVKKIVRDYDPFAFMTIQDANEVFGRGFTQKTDHNVKRPPELRMNWESVEEAEAMTDGTKQ